MRQLFNAIDPSPFRERDLDPGAADFIVGWTKDLPASAPLSGPIPSASPPADTG